VEHRSSDVFEGQLMTPAELLLQPVIAQYSFRVRGSASVRSRR
jgi:hypothetical protein